jgi:hypothetical protein
MSPVNTLEIHIHKKQQHQKYIYKQGRYEIREIKNTVTEKWVDSHYKFDKSF